MRVALCAVLNVAIVLCLLTVPMEAEAKGVIIYHTGQDIFTQGPLPAPYDKNKKLIGAKAGYKCKIFGLFWAYFTISGCEPVAFRGNGFWRDKDLAAAIKKKYPDVKVPFWKKHGRIVLGAGLILLILAGLMKKKKKKKKE